MAYVKGVWVSTVTAIDAAPMNNLETQYDEIQAILTNRGDIFFRNATVLARLAKGTQNFYLRQGANDPEWAAITKEMWITPTYGPAPSAIGDFGAMRNFTVAEVAQFAFRVPSDFAALTSAEIIIIPAVTEATANIDVNSDYAAVGEAYNTHSESEVAATYNIVTNQLFSIDISGVLSAIAANDLVGIKLQIGSTNYDLYTLGISFKYS